MDPVLERKEVVQRRYYLLNMVPLALVVLWYFVAFVVFFANGYTREVASVIFCCTGGVLCVLLLIFILLLALKYSGNPASKERYKLMIIKTRILLLVWCFTRLVNRFSEWVGTWHYGRVASDGQLWNRYKGQQ